MATDTGWSPIEKEFLSVNNMVVMVVKHQDIQYTCVCILSSTQSVLICRYKGLKHKRFTRIETPQSTAISRLPFSLMLFIPIVVRLFWAPRTLLVFTSFYCMIVACQVPITLSLGPWSAV